MKRLDNKIAIITGGNSGIGKATAELFCHEGAKVIISGRRDEENQKTVAEIRAKGGEISAIQADVTIPSQCEQMIAAVMRQYDHIDILVNNAGIADKHMPISECSESLYDAVCKADQYSVYYLSKYVLKYMIQQNCGSIVNVSSIGSQGVGGISYSAAKAAVNAMTKNIALQFSATPIRCNAVAPGPTPTPFNSPEQMKTFHTEFAGQCAKHIDVSLPTSTVEDQAEAILFFASDVSKSITGQILYVDHGTSLY